MHCMCMYDSSLDLKNITSGKKISPDGLNSGLNITEEKINDLEARAIEITENKEISLMCTHEGHRGRTNLSAL